jgi:thiamine phosphate phosphatase / amino-HMP aminohydrolase
MSIFLDFDGTITAKDTIGDLANFALRVQRDRGFDLQQEWTQVVKAYMDDCKQHELEYHLPENRRISAEHEVEYLQQMKDVEIRSLDRIRDSGVFKDIGAEQLRQAGRDALASGVIEFRDGFREFISARRRGGWKLYVISVNWSTAFIQGACSQAAAPDTGKGTDIEVFANEISPADGSIAGPAFLNSDPGDSPQILTNSADKLEVMRRVLQRDGDVESQGTSLRRKRSFYLGDSGTDLECLLAATTGVVMADGPDSKLLRTLDRIGVHAPCVNPGFGSDEKKSKDQQQMCWATSFTEIDENISFGQQLN